MKKPLYLKSTLVCCILLVIVSAAAADISGVSPSEGTIGTIFTISGSDFGMKEGGVFIGSRPCQVLAWNDTSIECRIKVPMPAGEYDLMLRSHGKGDPLTLPDAFSIMVPSIDLPKYRPHFVSPGDVVTIDGLFFGNGRGQHTVEIENLRGDKRPCRILDWTMESITFELPHGIPGIVHLQVTNAAGSDTQPWWGTFASPPENPPNLLGSYSGAVSHDNAAGVSYNGLLWAFYSHRVAEDNAKMAYRIYDGINWSSGYYLRTVDGVYQQSYAVCNPLVADDILYVFYTGMNGKLYYLTYDLVDSDYIDTIVRTDIWLPAQTIPDATVEDPETKFAAVYNFTKKCIEVYWTPTNYVVYMKTLDIETGTWGPRKTVQTGIAEDHAPYLGAVFNQLGEDDYVTYLSWNTSTEGYLAELKDGTNYRTWHSPDWKSVDSTKHGPNLVDLSDNYLAVIMNRGHDRSYYQKYDKDTHQPSGELHAVPFTSKQDTPWAPTGITFSVKALDPDSPTGYRMNSNFYAFVGNNPIGGDTIWEFVNCELLGYWKPTEGEGDDVDFGDQDILTNTFDQWPIIGVIDMPPYVENGKGPCAADEWDKCGTEVEFSFKKTTTTSTSCEYSAGPYMRSRAKSPVEFDASVGYAGGFENSETYEYNHSDTLDAGRKGSILVYYFAPKFTVWNLEWFDLDGQPTGLVIPSVQVTGGGFRKEVFPPHEGPSMSTIPEPYLDPAVFPYHGTEEYVESEEDLGPPEMDMERLLTYWKDPTQYGFESVADSDLSTGGWFPESGCDFATSITEGESHDNGFYVDFKIGAKMGVAFGVEGSFKMLIKTKTDKNVEALTTIKGPMTNDENFFRITEFHLEGYWLKPAKDAYWIPEYRKVVGDQPWFITYRVTDAWLQGETDKTTDDIPFFPPDYPEY